MKKLLFLLAVFIFGFASCSKDDSLVTDEGVVINGVRWATRNLDTPGTFVRNPEDAGRLYQWGTLGGRTHHWPNTGEITGWNCNSDRVAWTLANDPCPTGWRVPTREELQSLVDADNTGTHLNGVHGILFGTAPYQIFLPAAGTRRLDIGIFSNNTLRGDLAGAYWSSTPLISNIERERNHVLFLMLVAVGPGGSRSYLNSNDRAWGKSIRCVAR